MKRPTLRLPAALLLLSTMISLQADFKPHGYETPSYIDFELLSYSFAEDSPSAVVVILRQGDFRQQATVDFETEDGTASGGNDFKPSGGTLVFAPGETRKEVSIPLIHTQEAEATEHFYLKLTNPGPHTVLIRDSVQIDLLDVPAGPPVPKLQITYVGRGFIGLSWEASAGEFVLERAESTTATDWDAVPAEAVLVDDHFVVLQPVGPPQYFYRLRAR